MLPLHVIVPDQNVSRPTSMACLCANLFSLVGLIVIVLISRGLAYDESYHLANVQILHRYGLSVAFLKNLNTAPGPLFAIVHYLFEPLTQLKAPLVRMVTVFFLFLIIATLVFCISGKRHKNNPILSALSIIGVPMIMIIGGMALTEIPAMFFFYLGILLLLLSVQPRISSTFTKLILSLTSGLTIGMSILGRQMFFMILLALLFLVFRIRPRKNLLFILTTFCIAALPPLVLFFAWGGVVPPSVVNISNGFSIPNMLLSFSYAGMAMLILAPKWYSLGHSLAAKLFFLMLSFLILIGNLLTGFVQLPSIFSLANRLLHYEWLIWIYPRMFSGILIVLGALFLFSAGNNVKNNWSDEIFVFLTITGILILGAAGKITIQYSGRYPAIVVPLLALIADRYTSETYWKALRMGLGSAFGLLSLASYLRLLS